jgi:hypothetical protein
MVEYVCSGPASPSRTVQHFGQNHVGKVDNFRFYDRALPQENITALYRMGLKSLA